MQADGSPVLGSSSRCHWHPHPDAASTPTPGTSPPPMNDRSKRSEDVARPGCGYDGTLNTGACTFCQPSATLCVSLRAEVKCTPSHQCSCAHRTSIVVRPLVRTPQGLAFNVFTTSFAHPCGLGCSGEMQKQPRPNSGVEKRIVSRVSGPVTLVLLSVQAQSWERTHV